jgi:hypothetical protein
VGLSDPRRLAPRIVVDGLCGIAAKSDFRHAAMIELSAIGLRIELPFDRKIASRAVQLEIELPGVDEIVWARGEVTFAHLSPMGGHHPDGQPRFLCRAGIHIAEAAWRDRRMLRDFVLETRRLRQVRRRSDVPATGDFGVRP